jgi:predicted DsbA family dithiol-disulfide isomerase
MCEKARTIGITGVPMTIIDGKWAVSGGQSSDVYVQVRSHLRAPLRRIDLAWRPHGS